MRYLKVFVCRGGVWMDCRDFTWGSYCFPSGLEVCRPNFTMKSSSLHFHPSHSCAQVGGEQMQTPGRQEIANKIILWLTTELRLYSRYVQYRSIQCQILWVSSDPIEGLHGLLTLYWVGFLKELICFIFFNRDAGSPNVRIAVVGAGTGELFENFREGRDQLEVSFTPSKGLSLYLEPVMVSSFYFASELVGTMWEYVLVM